MSKELNDSMIATCQMLTRDIKKFTSKLELDNISDKNKRTSKLGEKDQQRGKSIFNVNEIQQTVSEPLSDNISNNSKLSHDFHSDCFLRLRVTENKDRKKGAKNPLFQLEEGQDLRKRSHSETPKRFCLAKVIEGLDLKPQTKNKNEVAFLQFKNQEVVKNYDAKLTERDQSKEEITATDTEAPKLYQYSTSGAQKKTHQGGKKVQSDHMEEEKKEDNNDRMEDEDYEDDEGGDSDKKPINFVTVKDIEAFPGILLMFVNVGQGNLTLARSPNKKEIWLVDAGSNTNPRNAGDNTIITKRAIFNIVADWIYRNTTPPSFLNIIVSHPDSDHLNLIMPIITTLSKRSSMVKETTLHFYFSEKHASSICAQAGLTSKFLRGSKFEKTELFVIRYEEGENIRIYEATLNSTSITVGSRFSSDQIDSGGMLVKFLNANHQAPETTSNDDSLVIKIIYAEHSCLLTGDATQRTFKLKDMTADIKDVSILQISHHGSIAKGCNSHALINTTQPSIAIMSSPLHASNYNHPNPNLMTRLFNHFHKQASEKDNSPVNAHFLNNLSSLQPYEFRHPKNNYFIKKKNSHIFFASPVINYRQKRNPLTKIDEVAYTLYLTSYPIFHTAAQGTICLNWKENESNIQISYQDFKLVEQGRDTRGMLIPTQNILQLDLEEDLHCPNKYTNFDYLEPSSKQKETFDSIISRLKDIYAILSVDWKTSKSSYPKEVSKHVKDLDAIRIQVEHLFKMMNDKSSDYSPNHNIACLQFHRRYISPIRAKLTAVKRRFPYTKTNNSKIY